MNLHRARQLTFVLFSIALIFPQGCNKDSDSKKPTASQPQPAPQVALDPPPNPAAVLEHLQRLVNQSANSAELFAERTNQLDPPAKREFLTCLTAAWSQVRVDRIATSEPSQSSQPKPIRGINIYLPEAADRLTLARLLVFDKPPATMICIMDDPKLSGFRYVIDSPALAKWTDEQSRKEDKH